MESSTGRSRRIWYIAGAIVLLLAIAAAGWWWYQYHRAQQVPNQYATTTVNAVLAETNTDFTTGVAQVKSKDFTDALASFNKALAATTDPAQQGLITYYIGSTEERLGQYASAIDTYKSVAANTNYRTFTRAYAVTAIGTLYNKHYDAHPAVVSATFTDTPYASFFASGNLNAAYTKLFEYAASIYPLAPAEAYIAYGHAKDLELLGGATTTPAGQADVAAATAALQAEQADLPRLTKNPDEGAFLPLTLARAALAQVYLARYGVPGYTNAGVEQSYKAAVAGAATAGIPAGNSTVWRYAAFLAAAYGKSRVADITTLLAPFTPQDKTVIDPGAVTFFIQIRIDPTLVSEKGLMVTLAKLDPNFKTYLLSIGWKTADF